MGSWRAGCVETRTSGSEERAGEPGRPKGRYRAPARPLQGRPCGGPRDDLPRRSEPITTRPLPGLIPTSRQPSNDQDFRRARAAGILRHVLPICLMRLERSTSHWCLGGLCLVDNPDFRRMGQPAADGGLESPRHLGTAGGRAVAGHGDAGRAVLPGGEVARPSGSLRRAALPAAPPAHRGATGPAVPAAD